MISIVEAVSDLLFVRDTVVVPGLGAFIKKPLSAKVNTETHSFSKPSSVIEFDANLREDNELVARYLSEKNEISETEARKKLVMFVSDSFNILKAKEKVVLKGIGILSFDEANNLVFEPCETTNYNSDAFGLSDFTMPYVRHTMTKEEIKEEIEKQQKDKNTPMTVDEEAVHEHDGNDKSEKHGNLVLLWVFLILLLAAAVIYGLHEFKVVRFPWEKEQSHLVPTEPKTYTLPTYVKEWKRIEPGEQSKIQDEEGASGSTVEVPTEAHIRIIAGCYDQEEYAARLYNTLKSKGYRKAFYEKRGTKWFVSFGYYDTDEEATAALREIRANTEYKAWILK